MIKKFVNDLSNSQISLISNSEFIHNLIKSKYNKDSKILYPPVELSEFSPKNKINHIISIGRFSEEKNLEFGIDVVSKLDSLYCIIGNTKTKSNVLYYKKLESKIKNLNLESKIKLLKNIDRSNLVMNLNNSKVYFHCSDETFGISVVESIAAGCIPIVPDTSAHKETVPFSELRYTSNDIKSAQEKIKQAISGDFDNLIIPLQNLIQKYDKEQFKQSLISIIDNFSN